MQYIFAWLNEYSTTGPQPLLSLMITGCEQFCSHILPTMIYHLTIGLGPWSHARNLWRYEAKRNLSPLKFIFSGFIMMMESWLIQTAIQSLRPLLPWAKNSQLSKVLWQVNGKISDGLRLSSRYQFANMALHKTTLPGVWEMEPHRATMGMWSQFWWCPQRPRTSLAAKKALGSWSFREHHVHTVSWFPCPPGFCVGTLIPKFHVYGILR